MKLAFKLKLPKVKTLGTIGLYYHLKSLREKDSENDKTPICNITKVTITYNKKFINGEEWHVPYYYIHGIITFECIDIDKKYIDGLVENIISHIPTRYHLNLLPKKLLFEPIDIFENE